jgi:hypothetical protein
VGALCGCERVLYRADTILHEDGKVERAVYQPLDVTPKEVRDPKKWRRATFALAPDALDKQGWPASLREFPEHGEDGSYRYFAAYQEYRAPQHIPNHWGSNEDSFGVPAAHLARNYLHNDFIFVAEYLWNETLTDQLTWERMQRSREELADLNIDLGREVFSEALGQEYDVSPLVDWCRTEGKKWFGELTDFIFVYAAVRKGKRIFEVDEALDEMATICARHGLHLKQAGKFLSQEDSDKVIGGYVTGLLLRHVRRRDGKPVQPEVVNSWVGELLGPRPKDKQSMFQAAADRVIATKYGGREALEKRWGTLFVSAFGHFFVPFGEFRFDYSMTMPGKIVATNGEILSEARVRWRFAKYEAFPLGYPMSCRSLLPRTKTQNALLGRALLVSRDDMLQFVELVADQKPLLQALGECSKHTTLSPLYTYSKGLSTSSAEGQRVRRLMSLLHLP